MRTADEIYFDIYKYFSDNEDVFNWYIEALDDYCGILNDDRWIPMDCFDEFLAGKTPLDIAQMIEYGDFDSRNDYFRFDGYGNIETTDYKEYFDDYGDNYIFERMSEHVDELGHIDVYMDNLLVELDSVLSN